MKTAPSMGLVILTLGGKLGGFWTCTVMLLPYTTLLLSVATAEKLKSPAGRLVIETMKGLAPTLPNDVAPWKNWTLVTVPSESEADAASWNEAGATSTAPS